MVFALKRLASDEQWRAYRAMTAAVSDRRELFHLLRDLRIVEHCVEEARESISTALNVEFSDAKLKKRLSKFASGLDDVASSLRSKM